MQPVSPPTEHMHSRSHCHHGAEALASTILQAWSFHQVASGIHLAHPENTDSRRSSMRLSALTPLMQAFSHYLKDMRQNNEPEAACAGADASTFFSRTMQVGNLPFGFDVPWRSSALLQEQTSGPGATDISGGWLTGKDLLYRPTCSLAAGSSVPDASRPWR